MSLALQTEDAQWFADAVSDTTMLNRVQMPTTKKILKNFFEI